MTSALVLISALLMPGESALRGGTAAEFALIGPAEANVASGAAVEVVVVVTNSERMAACGYRLLVSGSASATVTQRSVTPELQYLGADPQDPLGAGLPIALNGGDTLDDVFINLDTADPPGNPLDGFAPATQGVIATYTLVVSGIGDLNLTLAAPRAAETQTDATGVLFDTVTVDPAAANVSLTVTGGPDINGDTFVDLRDFAILQACFGLPVAGGCTSADVDVDGDIDAGDFAVLQSCLTGPIAAPVCAGGRSAGVRRSGE